MVCNGNFGKGKSGTLEAEEKEKVGKSWDPRKKRRKIKGRFGSLIKSSHRQLGAHTKYMTGTTELKTRMHGALCSIAISLLAF